MRPKLLQSFIVVLLFWLVASTVWWSFQRPAFVLSYLVRLDGMLPFLSIEVPTEATIMGSIGVQLKVLTFWTLPMAVLTFISGAIGYGLIWQKARSTSSARTMRESGSGAYRGITVTMGELPLPHPLPKDEIDLGADDESLACLNDRERLLLADVLGTISAHPDAYAGDGVRESLLEHTLNIASRALTATNNPGLTAIVAAAHEMGKITGYRKDKDGGWVVHKAQDKEGARILGMITSWYAMPTSERDALLMAVKYYSSPRFLPEINGNAQTYKLARELLATAEAFAAPAPAPAAAPAPVATPAAAPAQAQPVAQPVAPPAPVRPPMAAPAPVAAPAVAHVPAFVAANAPVATNTLGRTADDLPDSIFDALLRALPSLSFQNRGLPKGVAAVAWKQGPRVYLLEIKLRETVMAKLSADVRASLTASAKERSRLQPFTVELLKALDSRGWLVKKINDVRVETKDAVWNIKAGKLDFKGVIVVDVPVEYMTQLPKDDSMYDVLVTGPLFTQSGGGGGGGMNVTKQDLMGSVLRPASVEKPAGV